MHFLFTRGSESERERKRRRREMYRIRITECPLANKKSP